MDDASSIERLRAANNSRLGELVGRGTAMPDRLGQSMRHSLLAPGKRVRALVAMLASEHFGGEPLGALDPACALEMVHAASLVLDDLPAMDDSRLRRGLPANHCVYGEGTAILAAIGLMNRAFAVVSADETLGPGPRLEIIDALSWSIGEQGLIAGQELDLHNDASLMTVEGIEDMHGRKTGALFAAAARIGAIVANAGADRKDRAQRFGWRLGIAFQTFDDLVDRFASSEMAQKETGKDVAKPTVLALLGPERALERARQHLTAALEEICEANRASVLVGYVEGLGEDLMARLEGHNLELADGVSGH